MRTAGELGVQLHGAARRRRRALSAIVSRGGKGASGCCRTPCSAPRREGSGRIDDHARALAVDLLDTMRASPACVGLAATQIGVPLRAFAIDVTGHKKARSCHGEIVLFDPRDRRRGVGRDGTRGLHERSRPDRRRGTRHRGDGHWPRCRRATPRDHRWTRSRLGPSSTRWTTWTAWSSSTGAQGPHAVFRRKVYK